MGLLDNNKINAIVIPKPYNKAGFEILTDTEDYTISKFEPSKSVNNAALHAVWENIAVFAKTRAIYISTTGLDGDTVSVELNSTNFPHLIAESRIQRCCIVGYNRKISSGTTPNYMPTNWRLVVITDYGQIYHNFPSKADNYDGPEEDGDMLKFDESVIWDLPDRKFPVKTTAGNDANLIATGVYRYVPCLPDSMYEMHPGIDEDNGYGNSGFGAVKTLVDTFTGQQIKRPRYFVPVRGVYEGNSFNWINGLLQGSQYTIIGTYLSNSSNGYGARMGVFMTNDGREWFLQYEYGANSEIIVMSESGDTVIRNGYAGFSEYGSTANRLKWGDNQMTDNTAFILRKRSSYAPSEYNKEPEKTKKFKYGESIAISTIVSSESGDDGIIITTSSNHGLRSGDDIVIESVGGNADWDWICSKDHTQLSAGNGVIWKVQKITDTSLRLMLEVKNPNNNLSIRHIHSINQAKDGFIIGCGEEYPTGWIEYVRIPETDNFSQVYAGNVYEVIRLTSTNKSALRPLGVVFTEYSGDIGDNIFYFASDHYGIYGDDVEMPSGRTDTFKRNSTGVFKGALKDIDDISKMECILDTDEPCCHFSLTSGIMIFQGVRRTLALSKDNGKQWFIYYIPHEVQYFSWLMGTTSNREICLRRYDRAATSTSLIIKIK